MNTEEFEKARTEITDVDLIKKARDLLSELCKTGGKSFRMTVPPRIDDTDMIFSELIKRYQQGLSAGNAGYNFLAEYEEKFIVFHTKEYKHLTELQMDNLKDILWTIVKGRQGEGKKSENNYYVCNQDEPYAQKVIDIILEGETEKLKAKKL